MTAYALDRRSVAAAIGAALSEPGVASRALLLLPPGSVEEPGAAWVLDHLRSATADGGASPSAPMVLRAARDAAQTGQIDDALLEAIRRALVDASDVMFDDPRGALASVERAIRRQTVGAALRVAVETCDAGDADAAAAIVAEAAARADVAPGLVTRRAPETRSIRLSRCPTGLPDLDAAIDGGVAPGELAVMVLGSSEGKTSWAAQIAAATASWGGVAVVWSPDPPEAIEAKAQAFTTGVTIGRLSEVPAVVAARMEAAWRASGAIVTRCTPALGVDVEAIAAHLRSVRTTVGPVSALVVDEADLVGNGRADALRRLRALAQRVGVAVWATVTRTEEPLGWSPDVVMSARFRLPEPGAEDPTPIVALEVVKSRRTGVITTIEESAVGYAFGCLVPRRDVGA